MWTSVHALLQSFPKWSPSNVHENNSRQPWPQSGADGNCNPWTSGRALVWESRCYITNPCSNTFHTGLPQCTLCGAALGGRFRMQCILCPFYISCTRFQCASKPTSTCRVCSIKFTTYYNLVIWRSACYCSHECWTHHSNDPTCRCKNCYLKDGFFYCGASFMECSMDSYGSCYPCW